MIVPKSDVVTVHGDCDESVNDVNVLVEAFQTSVASVPNVERVLFAYDQIVAGNEVIIEASEVEAARTVVFVLALILATTDEEAASTVAFTSVVTLAIPEPSDVEALRIEALVLAFMFVCEEMMLAASDVDAVRIVAFVLLLIEVMALPTCELVFTLTALMSEASDVEAAKTVAFVLLLIAV